MKKAELQKLVEGGIILTISVGIATYPGNGETIRELMEKVDQAMYWGITLRGRVEPF